MHYIFEYFKKIGVDQNTTATIIITLIVFCGGLLFGWAGRKLKEYSERRNYKNSILQILKDFGESCNRQNIVVKRSLSATGLTRGKDFAVQFLPIGTLGFLQNIDLAMFLQKTGPIFGSKMYSKAVSKLFELIAQIKIQNDSIDGFMRTYSIEFKDHESKFQEGLVNLRRIHDDLGLELDGKVAAGPDAIFIQEYFNIFGKWHSNGAQLDYESLNSKLVEPVLKLSRSSEKSQLSLAIIEHALKCDIAYKNMDKIDRLLVEKVSKFAQFHRRASRMTSVIIKIIK